MLDATRLRVLVAVARHGSVTAAAHALNYAQPSISHHIARLEAETGAKLMERAGRGIKLTEAGQLLAGRAEEILGRLDAAEAELAAHIGLARDRVRLGCVRPRDQHAGANTAMSSWLTCASYPATAPSPAVLRLIDAIRRTAVAASRP
ncbi:MAG TPA: LysR family transcriptional regulator [Streptosporangiaceae bacterium]|nr:LysR family transcriptional regulator [Streptosporangiaceae bacterium]